MSRLKRKPSRVGSGPTSEIRTGKIRVLVNNRRVDVDTVIYPIEYGEMASHWGLNRTECQIHGLLFLSPKPLDAEEISKTLSVARSHVSNSIKELQSWGCQDRPRPGQPPGIL